MKDTYKYTDPKELLSTLMDLMDECDDIDSRDVTVEMSPEDRDKFHDDVFNTPYIMDGEPDEDYYLYLFANRINLAVIK